MTESDPNRVPECQESGVCCAAVGDRPAGTSRCQYCGKTLVLGRHGWLVWDHEGRQNPRVQDES